MTRLTYLVAVLGLVGACQKTDDKKTKSAVASITPAPGAGAGSAVLARPLQVAPPIDIKQPPPDATRTKSGLALKKLVTVTDGKSPQRNDTVMVSLVGWKQATGETFRSTREPEPMPLANSAPGFVEALGLLKKGERAIVWMPAELGYRERPKAGGEALVYEIEIGEIHAAPPTPPDVAAPPAGAQTTPLGSKYVVVRPGEAKTTARPFDTVTYHYTGWDSTGRIFDTTEIRKKAVTTSPLKQPPAMEEMLRTTPAGARVRFWVASDKLAAAGKPVPANLGAQVCYEVEVASVSKAVAVPPPTPADLKSPPAQKSPKGVAYRVLKPGKGPKPGPTDVVRAKYTGWTADGRIFETWVTRGDPFDIALNGTMTGFADVLPLLDIGATARLWIPEDLAYKGAPGKPQGPLVVDLELVEIRQPKKADPHGHGHGDEHGDEGHEAPPAPPDVAGPPKDAKRTALGVSYKVLSAGKGGPKPNPTDRVKVHYTGWQTDGTMFDSSVKRGQPAEFSLQGVIKGWTDGIPVMSVGDKVRFWIPEELAYKGSPSKPQGMLVFDVELLEIKPGP